MNLHFQAQLLLFLKVKMEKISSIFFREILHPCIQASWNDSGLNYVGLKTLSVVCGHPISIVLDHSPNSLSLISLSIPSLQLLLGLPLCLLPAGVHLIICFGSRLYATRCTWPCHFGCFIFMSFTIACRTTMICRVRSLRIFSSFGLPATRHQKPISVDSKDFFTRSLSDHISLPQVTMLLTMELYMLCFLFFEIF